jgi:hypothetical protein
VKVRLVMNVVAAALVGLGSSVALVGETTAHCVEQNSGDLREGQALTWRTG